MSDYPNLVLALDQANENANLAINLLRKKEEECAELKKQLAQEREWRLDAEQAAKLMSALYNQIQS